MRMLVGMLILALFVAAEVALAGPNDKKVSGTFKPDENTSQTAAITVEYDTQNPKAAIRLALTGQVGALRDGKVIRGSTFNPETGKSIRIVIDLKPEIVAGKAVFHGDRAVFVAKCENDDNTFMMFDTDDGFSTHCFYLK